MNQGHQSCSVCGADTRQETITYTQIIGERVYIVTDVPAEVCPRCGEQYLSPDVVDALQGLMERGHPPKKIIQVPVYQFSRSIA